MKYFKSTLVFVALGLIFCLLSSQAGAKESVTTEELTIVKLGAFEARIYPSNKYRSGGLGVMGTEEGYLVVWVDYNCSIIALNNHLFLNEQHYLIPEGCKVVWVIEGIVVALKTGRISKSPPTKKVLEALKEERCDFEMIKDGIRFRVESGIYASGGKFTNHENFEFSIGELYFVIENGRLKFRAKDYGKVQAGDVVKIDPKRQITVEKQARVDP